MKTITCLAVAGTMILLTTTRADARQSPPSPAAELVQRLGSGAATAFAAAVPDSDSRFVAVMHIPGVQLLVITADYSAPSLLRELLLKGEHQRVYQDLHAAAERNGRFFVEDLGADGLKSTRAENAAFDITWRDGTQRTLYDGAWKGQKLSEQEYRERFEKDAEEYARLLRILLAAHAGRPTTQLVR